MTAAVPPPTPPPPPAPHGVPSAPSTRPHIRLVHLHKQFGPLTVFNDVSLTVHERECVH